MFACNKLGVTTSPKTVNTALDLLGDDYDKPLQNWKEQLVDHLKISCQSNKERRKLETRREELDKLDKLADEGLNVVDQLTAVDDLMASVNEEKRKIDEQKPSGFSIVLDNLDLRVLASDMTSYNQNKDYHWCNHNAYLDRVNPKTLPDDGPRANL